MDPRLDVPRPSRRPPWWVPLLIPAITLILTGIDTAHRGTHIVHSTGTGAAVGAFALAALIGIPAFLSGILYNRQVPPDSN